MLLGALWYAAITVHQLVLLVRHHHLQLRLGDLYIHAQCVQYDVHANKERLHTFKQMDAAMAGNA